MHRAPSRTTLALPLALAALASCLSPGEPKPLRYWRAELAGAVQAPRERGRALRIRRTEAAGHLRERVAVRTSPVEYELQENERWTEPPIAYVQRSLERALFEEAGLARSEALSAPALDLRLGAFEEVREPERAAEVELHLVLFDATGSALLERRIQEREPLASSDPGELALALRAALERAAGRAARELRAALEAADG